MVLISYLTTFLFLMYIFFDLPFNFYNNGKKLINILKKYLRIILIIMILIHGIFYWYNEKQITSQIVSGVLLLGLIIAYMMSSETSGIEDKVARKYFKILSWVSIWLVTLLHLIYGG